VSIVPRRAPDAGIWIHGSILPRRAPGTAAGERVVSRLYHRDHHHWQLVLTRPMVTNRNGHYRAWLGGAMRGICRVTVRYSGDPVYLPSKTQHTFTCQRR
jgi:hypothetical protein